jgi:hypothetical protein
LSLKPSGAQPTWAEIQQDGRPAQGRPGYIAKIASAVKKNQFPLPWTVQERSTCFVVHDKTSQPLAYIHFEDKSGRLSSINQLTRDEALRIAENIAKLPELLRKT